MAVMSKKLKLFNNQKGMTLIELMAVVVILGILAAVAGAAVMGGFSKSKQEVDKSSQGILSDAAQRCIFDTKCTAPSNSAKVTIPVATLYSNGYLKSSTIKWQQGSSNFGAVIVTADSSGNYTYTYQDDTAGSPVAIPNY